MSVCIGSDQAELWGCSVREDASELTKQSCWGYSVCEDASELTKQSLWGCSVCEDASELTKQSCWGCSAREDASELTKQSCWGCSACEDACHQTFHLVFLPWNPRCRRREPTHLGCPLTSLCMPQYVCHTPLPK